MSASSGNPRLQVAADVNEGNKRGPRDVEQGDLHTEKQRFSPNLQGSSPSNEETPEDEGDEYIRLLKFIDLESKKEKRRRDEDRADEEDQEMQRLWYMPWKKIPVRSTKDRKVPLSWLETDISQGLSLSEVDGRRARFGYNELERYVDQSPALQWNCVSTLHTVRESIPLSSFLDIFVAQFFSVRTATARAPFTLLTFH